MRAYAEKLASLVPARAGQETPGAALRVS